MLNVVSCNHHRDTPSINKGGEGREDWLHECLQRECMEWTSEQKPKRVYWHGREGGKEGEKQGGREGGRDGGREGGREGSREGGRVDIPLTLVGTSVGFAGRGKIVKSLGIKLFTPGRYNSEI